jgi:hypothetical protein
MATKERLMDLERTVDTLNGRLQNVQWELQQVKAGSLTERLWKNLVGSWQGSEFMSAVCNRRVRPNTKVVDHAGSARRY